MKTPASAPQRLFALAVMAFALWAGVSRLSLWIAPGTAPGARGWLDTWPLVLIVGALLISGAGLAVRADPRAWALGALGWAMGVSTVTELPLAVTTHHIGDGPWLVPVYALIGLSAAFFGVVGLRGHSLQERTATLLILFTVANGWLFSRGESVFLPLLLAAALLGLVGNERRRALRDLIGGSGRALSWIVAAFLLWTLVAAASGASPTHGLASWSTLLTGALVAWTLASSLGPRGAGRAYGALVVGLALALVVLLIGTLEASSLLGWSWLKVTRLRLFDLHPGLIAPFFAVGLCLVLARAVASRGKRSTVSLCCALAACTGLALALSQARASVLGAVLGLAVLVLALGRRLPRRGVRLGAFALGAAALGPLLFFSPLGQSLQARLESMTFTASALGQRYHYWQMAAGAIRRDPLVGQGLRSEWARTDLAAPSYLDGGDQDLHAHNLLLSLGEAAGLPGLMLFLLLALGVLELGRRATLETTDPAARALSCGLVAGLVAHLGANMLSMGQALTTIVPLFLWVALGLLAALRGPEPREVDATSPFAMRAGAFGSVVVLLGLCVAPVTGDWMTRRGRAALERGEAGLALELFDSALAWHPLDQGVQLDASQALYRAGQSEAAIARLQRACASAPRRAKWQFTRGAALLDSERPAEALAAFERAFALDPLGRQGGDYLAACAWAHLRLGEARLAAERLGDALRRGSTYWKVIPKLRLAPRPGDGPEVARLGFMLGDPDSSRETLPLDDLLEVIGAEALAALDASPPEVTLSRRLITRVCTAYQAERVWAEPLALMEAYAARVPNRFSGTDSIYAQLLWDAGRKQEAQAVIDAGTGVRGRVPTEELLRYLRTRFEGSGELAILERAQRLAADIDLLDQEDVWFKRGQRHDIYDFLAELALRRGERDQAQRYHALALHDTQDLAQRAATSARMLRLMIGLGEGDTALADQAARFVFEASRAPGPARDEAALGAVARDLAEAFSDRSADAALLVEQRLRDDGGTGALFLTRLRAALRAQ